MTVLFEKDILNQNMKLEIQNKEIQNYLDTLLTNAANDRRFVLYLLAATGICVVPISSFCCKKDGFRITLLEEDPAKFEYTFATIAERIREYLQSA